jgi:hypothetical protein
MRTFVLTLVFGFIACKSDKTSSTAHDEAESPAAAPKPATAKPAEESGGDGTAMALDEGRGHPTSIVDDADYEAKLLGQYERANQLLVAGVNRSCDELAVDMRKLHDQERMLAAGLGEYAKAHAGVDATVGKKLQPKLDRFTKSAEPTFAHCKGNKAFLDAVTKAE